MSSEKGGERAEWKAQQAIKKAGEDVQERRQSRAQMQVKKKALQALTAALAAASVIIGSE